MAGLIGRRNVLNFNAIDWDTRTLHIEFEIVWQALLQPLLKAKSEPLQVREIQLRSTSGGDWRWSLF
jgi:hypothetical protein